MFASNVPGYDQWVVDLFNETTADRNNKSFREIVGSFAKMLNDDFYTYVRKEQATIIAESTLDFALCGYNQHGEPRIAQISWKRSDQLFIPRLIASHCYITGIPHIGIYLADKVKDYLPSMNTMALQRLATLLKIETSIRTTANTIEFKNLYLLRGDVKWQENV